MKRISLIALSLLFLWPVAQAIEPLSPVKGVRNQLAMPQVNIPTMQDAKHLLEETPLPSKTYGPSSSADGLGTYKTTCPTRISSLNTISETTFPVLLVEFSDVKFLEISTPDKISRQLNEENYSDTDYKVGATSYSSTGSVRDYFLSQSSGLFSPHFVVVGKVALPQTQAYYFKDSGNNRDVNTYAFINDAISAAQAQGIDFSAYTINDNPNINGTKTRGVPMLAFICAGYSEASIGYSLYHYSQDESGLDMPWPHFSRLVNTSGTQYGRAYGNFTLMSYFIGCERFVDTMYQGNVLVMNPATVSLAGPGTFVHEFGHALGLPDFYSTDSNVQDAHTPKYWSMMDQGNYYNMGYNFIGYSAYERILLGWLKYTTLNSTPKQCTLYPFSAIGQPDTPSDAVFAYVIKNPLNTKEYYVLENRRADGLFYPTKMGSGMLVTHVYFDYNKFEANALNNDPSVPRYNIIPADGKWQDGISGNNYKNDLFPGVSGIYTTLTDDSSPQNAVCWAGSKKVLQRPLYNIRKDGELIRFDIMKDFAAEGIEALDAGTSASRQSVLTFDLQGRPCPSASRSGIHIQGGHKFIK